MTIAQSWLHVCGGDCRIAQTTAESRSETDIFRTILVVRMRSKVLIDVCGYDFTIYWDPLNHYPLNYDENLEYWRELTAMYKSMPSVWKVISDDDRNSPPKRVYYNT